MKLVRGFVVLLLFTLVFSACQSKYMTSAKVYMQQNSWKNAKEQLLLEIEHHPQNGEAYAYLGEAYEKEGDYLKSGENFTKAKELVTKKKPLQKIKDTQLSLSGKHVTRGTQFHGAEEYGKAVDEYEIATQIYPEYLLARHNLAIALLKAERIEDGKRAWGDVLALTEEGTKEWMEAHSLLSRLAHQDTNYTLAMEHNEALLKADPENIELLSFKAVCLEALGKFEEALAIYEIIIKLDPGNVDAWFNMGVIHDRLEDTAKAEECFRMAAEAAPEDKDAQYNLGIMANKMENWELMKTAFQKVVELEEYDAAGWQNLSIALVKLGDTKAAQEAFDKATAIKDLAVLDSALKTGEHGNRYVAGTVKNNSDKQYSYVKVDFNLYDESGAQVGSTSAIVENLEPNGTWKFEAIVIEENVIRAKCKGITGH